MAVLHGRMSRARYLEVWVWGAAVMGLCAAVPTHAQTDPAECERLFSGQQIITTTTDLDGDSKVLSASLFDNKIARYGNVMDCNGNGVPDGWDVEPKFVAKLISAARAQYTFAADLDGDEDTDILSADFFGARIAWYENTDGLGTFGPFRVITTDAAGAVSVFAADLDGDGDIDALSTSLHDNKIAWYENTDSLGTFGPQQVISTAGRRPHSVSAADLDGDGDTDVLSASVRDNKIAWYENSDGLGTFGPQQVITTAALSAGCVFAADLDGDGDIDVLSASFSDDKIAWYENTDGLGSFGPQQIITTDADGAAFVIAADADRDGDMDVFSASVVGGIVAWHENTDGQGTFGPQQIISTANGVASLFAADLDGDGDTDVLSASVYDDKIAWFENTDGLGAFGPQQVIAVSANGADSIFAADLNGDGNIDVVSESELMEDRIAWYENVRFSQDCNDNDVPDECDVDQDGDGLSQDCNGNTVPDECEPDEDLDSVPDGCDLCPDSRTDDLLIVHCCETGVENAMFDDGCTMADLIAECEDEPRNHGNFLACVGNLARQWKRDRFITGREHGLIVSCAAKSASVQRPSDRSSLRQGVAAGKWLSP